MKQKTVLIAGGDGYLGYPLCLYLTKKGYKVVSVDNLSRREWVTEIGSHSAIPIEDRDYDWETVYIDITKYDTISSILRTYMPDVIIHLAEQPSAPFSMIDVRHAVFTHENNVNGTLNVIWAMKEYCPNAVLIKLGSMGEWGCPNIDIPEGFFEIEYRGRKDTLPFPRQAPSYYHQTKVHDSNNIMFACKIWGLKSIDIMQGPVYGSMIDEVDSEHKTRYDFDAVFGTVLNRFCAQAVIDYPLTVYGKGEQIRGYININDSMRCIELCINQSLEKGEYRVINQWTEKFTINELAELVKQESKQIGFKVRINHIDNPRVEKEEHYYNPDHQKIYDMGLKPRKLKGIIIPTLKDLLQYKDRIEQKKDFILPTIDWKKGRL